MSVTCCPLSYDDDNHPSFCETTTPIARKDHKCSECREVIPAGAKYEKCTGKWDDCISTFRTCMSCVEIRNHFACDGGWLFEHVWEDIEQNFFPDMKAGGPCMEGLSPAAKGRLFERRLKWLEDNAE